METILSNLKSDSANLHNLIEFNNSRVKALDSLDRFRYQNLTDTSVLKNFLPHINSAIIFSFFTISKVGVDQMKSSNGFRLIKQRNVVDSIFAYYDFNSVLDENSDYINYFQRQIFNLYHKLFEPNNLIETSSILGRNRGSVIEFSNCMFK